MNRNNRVIPVTVTDGLSTRARTRRRAVGLHKLRPSGGDLRGEVGERPRQAPTTTSGKRAWVGPRLARSPATTGRGIDPVVSWCKSHRNGYARSNEP